MQNIQFLENYPKMTKICGESVAPLELKEHYSGEENIRGRNITVEKKVWKNWHGDGGLLKSIHAFFHCRVYSSEDLVLH